jgi:hypothetical protein
MKVRLHWALSIKTQWKYVCTEHSRLKHNESTSALSTLDSYILLNEASQKALIVAYFKAGTIPALPWKVWGKRRKPSVSMANLRSEIWTRDLSNTKPGEAQRQVWINSRRTSEQTKFGERLLLWRLSNAVLVLNSGGIDPRILNLWTRWTWVVSLTPRPLYSRYPHIGGWVGPEPNPEVLLEEYLDLTVRERK